MKNNKLRTFTRIIYAIFLITTIMMLFMAYKNVDGRFVLKLGAVYIFLTIFMIIYIIFLTVLNLRKLKWIGIRKRLISFIGYFILFGALICFMNYIFTPSKLDIFRTLSIAFGAAFGTAFAEDVF